MKYDHLIEQVAKSLGLTQKTVRDVLFAVPDVLITLGEEEMVRTPLGVFRMMKRAARSVTPPDGASKIMSVKVPAEMVVKMRAGSRLRKKPA